jgi:hypothetical protein
MTIARKALLHERTDSDEDAWLHSEQLKALVAVERFVVEIEAEFWKTPGIAYTVAIQNVLKRWRADMVKP